MKIKSNYILRDVSGVSLAISTNDTATFGGMLKLNETGKFLWEQLKEDKTEEQLSAALLAEYDVQKEVAEKDIANFLEALRQHGVLEE